MFSYIYTDGDINHRGLKNFSTAKTEAAINNIALNYIRSMIDDYDAPNRSDLLTKAISAVESKDIKQAITAWNTFAKLELKYTIARHDIQSITFVE